MLKLILFFGLSGTILCLSCINIDFHFSISCKMLLFTLCWKNHVDPSHSVDLFFNIYQQLAALDNNVGCCYNVSP